MILVKVTPSAPEPPPWLVKAVIVYHDGANFMVWRRGDLAALGIQHPEVLVQLTTP